MTSGCPRARQPSAVSPGYVERKSPRAWRSATTTTPAWSKARLAPSEPVLDAIAQTLRLTPDQRASSQRTCCSPRRLHPGSRLRHRPRAGRGRRETGRDGAGGGHTDLHEPGASRWGQEARRPDRRLLLGAVLYQMLAASRRSLGEEAFALHPSLFHPSYAPVAIQCPFASVMRTSFCDISRRGGHHRRPQPRGGVQGLSLAPRRAPVPMRGVPGGAPRCASVPSVPGCC
jgi:hypothetical protein